MSDLKPHTRYLEEDLHFCFRYVHACDEKLFTYAFVSLSSSAASLGE